MLTSNFKPVILRPVGNMPGFGARSLSFTSHAERSQDEPHYLASPEIRSSYRLGDAPHQRRFFDRVSLVPTLDLSDFFFSAKVDFVQIKATSYGYVNRADLSKEIYRRAYQRVSVSGDGKGRLSLKLQDPWRWDVASVISAVQSMPGLHTKGEIDKIEVAIDVSPRYFNAESLRWAMTDLLWRHFLPPSSVWDFPGGQPRSVYGDGPVEYRFLWKAPSARSARPNGWTMAHVDMIRAARNVEYDETLEFQTRLNPWNYQQPAVNGTTYFGKKNGEVMFRIMHKLKDRQDRASGTAEILDDQERRSRIEVTLRGDALRRHGLTSCDHIGGGLRMLRKELFKFWLPTMSATQGQIISPFELERFQRGGVYAVRQAALAAREKENYLNRRVRGRRYSTKGWRRIANDDHEGLHAFSALNKRCADALRRAERSWARLD